MTSPPTCTIDGCAGPVFARGWCSRHYSRWQRNGDPLVTRRTPPMTATATEKHCPRCANVKPISEFGKRPNGKPTGYCLECTRRYDAEYAATPEGREARRSARAKWNDSNHDYFLNYRYGISRERYDEMLVEQNGGCAICGVTKPGGRSKTFHVDHCHSTLKVRGLLCAACNHGLGHFYDDPARLRAAAEYLEAS